MKKHILIPIALLAFFFSSQGQTQAQTLQYFNVNFDFKRSRIFNDTMLVFQLRVEGQSAQGNSLIGEVVLNLCNCYCDSLWDAWPDCYPNCFTGNGGLEILTPDSFSSSSGGTVPSLPSGGRLKGRGMLAIKRMEGGQELDTPFLLPVSYKVSVE